MQKFSSATIPTEWDSVGRGQHEAADGIIANPELYPAEMGLDAQKTASPFLPDYVCEVRI